MSEHCEHCADECRNGDIPYGPRKDHYNEGECAVWERENCPACAERQRIVGIVRKKLQCAEDSLPVGTGKVRAGYGMALADVARELESDDE